MIIKRFYMSGRVTAMVPAGGRYFSDVGPLLMNKLILSNESNLVKNIESLSEEIRNEVNELEWMFEPKEEDRVRIINAFPHLHSSRISAKVQTDVLPNEMLISIFSCLGTQEIAGIKSVSRRYYCCANTTMDRRVGQPTMHIDDFTKEAPFYGCHKNAGDPFIRDISPMSPYCKLRELILNGTTDEVQQLESLTLRARRGITALNIDDKFFGISDENFTKIFSALPNLEELSLFVAKLRVPFILEHCHQLKKITLRHGNASIFSFADFQLLKQRNLTIDLAGESIDFSFLETLANRVPRGADERHFGALSPYCPTLRKICVSAGSNNEGDLLNYLRTLSFDVRSKIDTFEYMLDNEPGVDHHAILRSLIPLFPNLNNVTIKKGYVRRPEELINNPFDDEILLFLATTCRQLKEIYYWNKDPRSLDLQVTSETLEELRHRLPSGLTINLHVFSGIFEGVSEFENSRQDLDITNIHSLLTLAKIYDHSINQFTYYRRHDLSKIVPFLGKITRLKIVYSNLPNGSIIVDGAASFATLPLSVRNNIGHLLVSTFATPNALTRLRAWRNDFFPNAIIQPILR